MKPMILAMAFLFAISTAGCGNNSESPGSSMWPGAGADGLRSGTGKGMLLLPFNKEWAVEVAGLGFGATSVVEVPPNDLKENKLVSRLVVTSTTDGQIHAFDWDTGQAIWVAKMAGAAGDPVFANGKIIATCSDGSVNAFSAWDGKVAWSSRFRSSAKQVDPIWAGRPENAAPVADDANVYTVHSTKTVNAFNIADGKEAWRLELADALMCSPVVVDGMLVVADYAQKINALDARNGNRIWESELADRITSSLLSDGRNVYAPGSFGTIEAFSLKDGKRVWTLDIDGTIGVSPCFSGNDLVVADTSKGRILFISTETGVIRQTVDAKGVIARSALVSSQNFVCFGSNDGRLMAVDTEKFSISQAFAFESSRIKSSSRTYGCPAVIDGRVLVSDGISTYYKLVPAALIDKTKPEGPNAEEKKNP